MKQYMWLRDPDAPGMGERPRDGSVFPHIRSRPESSTWPVRTLAHPERVPLPGETPEPRSPGWKPIAPLTLWADPHRQHVYAHVIPEHVTTRGEATFSVYGSAGETLASITVEPPLRGRGLRTCVTVRQTGGPEVVGFEGRIFWWWVWWLLAPIHIPLRIALTILLEEYLPMPRPTRTRWRVGGKGRTVLEWRSVGRKNETVEHSNRFTPWLHMAAEWFDPRVAAALPALRRGGHRDAWAGT
jgi:hypothetical protein